MSEAITPTVSQRICDHMNQDHQGAVLAYAQVFGALPAATGAQLISIDAQGMNLQVQVGESLTECRIPFAEPLADAAAAHTVLVAMAKEARAAQV